MTLSDTERDGPPGDEGAARRAAHPAPFSAAPDKRASLAGAAPTARSALGPPTARLPASDRLAPSRSRLAPPRPAPPLQVVDGGVVVGLSWGVASVAAHLAKVE